MQEGKKTHGLKRQSNYQNQDQICHKYWKYYMVKNLK